LPKLRRAIFILAPTSWISFGTIFKASRASAAE
jgi:hypothetical protein